MTEDVGVWSAEQVSKWLGFERGYFMKKIRTQPGFPSPLDFGIVCKGTPNYKWAAADIREWLDQKRKAA